MMVDADASYEMVVPVLFREDSMSTSFRVIKQNAVIFNQPVIDAQIEDAKKKEEARIEELLKKRERYAQEQREYNKAKEEEAKEWRSNKREQRSARTMASSFTASMRTLMNNFIKLYRATKEPDSIDYSLKCVGLD